MTGTAAEGLPFGDSADVESLDGFVAALDRLRRRAARGTGRTRVSLEQLAADTGIPRSTVHSYLRGQRLPPSDVLDRIVVALGATRGEQAGWANLLDRLSESRQEAPAAATPSPRTTTVPRLLPAAPAGFVGRVDELELVDTVLAAHDPAGAAPLIACLTGTGGVGKTALALSWAHTNTSRFPDGQLWVDLRGYAAAEPVTPVDALERLLRAIGVGTTELPADVDARADLFRSSLAGRRMLIVLDNARNAAQVQPLLAGTNGTTTLVTSRDSLRPLTVTLGAIRIPIERLADDDAVRLITAGLPPDTVDHVRASDLVDRCGGLPLALRIVGERLDGADPDEIRRLAEDFAREKNALHDSLDLDDASVEVGVRSAFDWSYEALPPEAARLFRLLPLCLSTTLDIGVAASLLGVDTIAARRQVDRLVAAHLLDSAGSDQVRVHDLVARYAWERLQRDETDDWRRSARVRFLDCLIDRCEQASAALSSDVPWRITRLPVAGGRSGLSGIEPGASGVWVADHAETLASAIRDAMANDLPRYAYVLSERAFRALYMMASPSILDDVIAAARDQAEANGDLPTAVLLCGLLVTGFGRATRLDEAERALTWIATRIDDLPEGSRPDARRTMANLALVRSLRGDLRRAVADLVELHSAAGDSHFDTWVLLNLMAMHLQGGDIEAAGAAMKEFEAIPDSVRGHRFLVHEDPINFEVARGAWSAARRRLVDFDIADQLGVDASRRVGALTSSARVDAAEGELVRAEASVDDAVALARRAGCRSREMAAVSVRAEILTLSGRADEAILILLPEVGRSRELGLRYAECQTLSVLARALTAASRDDEANEAAGAAAAIAAECGYGLLAREIAGDMPEPVSRAYLSW